MKLLVLSANPDWMLLHRHELLEDFARSGCEITAAASGPRERASSVLAGLGGKYVPLGIKSKSLNPFGFLRDLGEVSRLVAREKPDAIFCYTIKSVIWGALAAWRHNVRRVYPLMCGLGYAFMPASSVKQRLVAAAGSLLYRLVFRRATCVFFENKDDVELLESRGILKKKTARCVLNGAGINLDHFAVEPMDHESAAAGKMNFLFVARLLKSKGLPEFAAAARLLRERHPEWQFHVVGPLDNGPDGVPTADVEAWVKEGAIQWHGSQSDVRPFFKACHAFVLPTWYREGVPRTLLEAIAMGRPVITTDSVGARETVTLDSISRDRLRTGTAVVEGENGFLIRPQSAGALAAALEQFGTSPERFDAWAAASRRLAETRFEVHAVNRDFLRHMSLDASSTSSPAVTGLLREPSLA